MIGSRVVVNISRSMIEGMIAQAVEHGLNESCPKVVQTAKKLSPVDTAENRRSISCYVKRKGNRVSAAIFTQSGHGGYLETGTRNMRARPYIFPAFTRHKGGFMHTQRKTILAQFKKNRGVVTLINKSMGVKGIPK